MHMYSQNTAFFHIDDHELTPIKGKSEDFSIEIIDQAVSSKSSINLQLSLPHSWELVYLSGQCFVALAITDPNRFYPDVIFSPYLLVTVEEEEATFAFNPPCSKICGLESFEGPILDLRRPTSQIWIPTAALDFPWSAFRQGCVWRRRTREGQTGFDFWMMGKHHSKDDIWIVLSCTRDLEMGMWFSLQSMAEERLKATASSHGLGELWALTQLITCTPLICLTTTSYKFPDLDQASALTLVKHPHYGKKCFRRAGIPINRRSTRKNSDV